MITEEEKRNGWTEETLKDYLQGRERAQLAKATNQLTDDPNSLYFVRKAVNNHKYNPKRWRCD